MNNHLGTDLRFQIFGDHIQPPYLAYDPGLSAAGYCYLQTRVRMCRPDLHVRIIQPLRTFLRTCLFTQLRAR